MRGAAHTLFWTWVILDTGSVSLPQSTDRAFIDDCVRGHNRARSAVQPPASDMLHMTWDEGLAATAAAWAKTCAFQHSVRRTHPAFPSVGENIWAGYPPSSFTVRKAVENWVNENENYSYKGNRCKKVCTHYTQVVWASSYKVGCAVQLCPGGVTGFSTREGAVYVCHYGPAGNIGTMQPYNSEGSACSQCKGICQENLCCSPERDEGTCHDQTPDQEPPHSGQVNYAMVLIIRPIALFFTFIAAHAVRYKYPSMFCYE